MPVTITYFTRAEVQYGPNAVKTTRITTNAIASIDRRQHSSAAGSTIKRRKYRMSKIKCRPHDVRRLLRTYLATVRQATSGHGELPTY